MMPHASYIGQNSQIKLLMGGAGRMTPPPNLRLSPAPLPKDPRIRTPDRSCGQERSAAKGPKSGRSATPQAASRPYDLTQTEVISYRIASLLSSVKFATFFLEVPVPVLEALSTNINNYKWSAIFRLFKEKCIAIEEHTMNRYGNNFVNLV